MSVLDRLDSFCSPVSTFWRSESSCFHNRSSCHDEVDLSLCFEDTAILYSILFFLWFLAGFTFLAGRSRHRGPLPVGFLHVTKLLLLLLVLLSSLSDFFYTIDRVRRGKDVASFQYLSPLLLFTTTLMVGLVMHKDRKVGQRTSGLLLCFWILMTVYGSLKLRTYILTGLDKDEVEDVFLMVMFGFQFATYLCQLPLSLIPEPKAKGTHTHQQERRPCPEEDATFLSRITWWWQNGQIWQGWRRPLVYDDLSDLCWKNKSKVVAAKFQKHWDYEVQSAGVHFTTQRPAGSGEDLGNGEDSPPIPPRLSFELKSSNSSRFRFKKLSTNAEDDGQVALVSRDATPPKQGGCCGKRMPSLMRVLAKTFFKTFLASAVLKLMQDLLLFVNPQLLKLMIRFTQDESLPDWRGYVYAVLLFVAAVLQSLFINQYFHRCFTMGMDIRTAVIAAIYSKALKMSNKARQTSTVGEIVNLMSVDAQRFMDTVTYIHMLWSAPLQITLALIFLYQAMGPSIFAGFAVMVILIPLNGFLSAQTRKLQVKQMKQKDMRIKLVNEVLNGIKVIKLYAWELPFEKLIHAVRNTELALIRKTSLLMAFMLFSFTCAPFMVALATFATFALANANNPDQRLTADRAFVAIALFNILRFPLTMLPMVATSLIQASVSLKRLSKFLQNAEVDPNMIDWIPVIDKREDYAVKVKDASFSWDSEKQEDPTLSDLNLGVKPGQLVAVVGQVGAGKSSLIQALVGEMEKLEGHVTLKGSVAYVPQQAWIQNVSLQDNILFGKKLNTYVYDKTIKGCALDPDIKILPGGDQTEIGEKGINLSGGQKQRVSLARAVYQDADIYLLDDPLSAVDSHVGKHIFDNIIGPDGIIKNKVRILVTHGLSFLPQCDLIVVMVDGKISETGNYAALVENNGAFAEFLRTYVADKEEEEDPAGEGESPVHKVAASASMDTPPTKRQLSKQKSDDDKTETDKRKLTTEEEAKTGRVHFSILVEYCRACTWHMSVLVVVLYVLLNVSSVGGNFWLAAWSNAEERSLSENFTRSTACDGTDGTTIGCYLGIYAIFGFSQATFVLLSTLAVAIAAFFASRTLHNSMLDNILRTPMSFFDTTPLGRILNRFSKDVNIIDETIPRSLRTFLSTFISMFSTIIAISVALPIFLVVIIPMSVLYLLVQRLYVATSRQLKRLESITRSPIYSHFQETLMGVASIRAYQQQERFLLESERRVDYNQIANYPTVCANRWLAVRLEFVGNLVIFFAATFAAIQRNHRDELGLHISPGLVGLSISYALSVTANLNWVVRMTSELETNIVAVERTKEYAEIPTEAPPIIKDRRPDPDWPQEGRVKFEEYSTRYRKGLDLVLSEISVDIPGGTKVGIVGRTGAGKSSLTLALFRIIESAGGVILIDGVNIADYGLNDVRSRITIIPQDPVLFSGSLRLNLDPFEEYKDEELWRVLECAHLSTFVSTLKEGLQYTIAEGGENLSVGQCQLVCLARALLRKTKILVLDEATAAVDLETDNLIQKTIRTEFADCTVITIAHRLNTIMDYDKIIILEEGKIKEFAAPGDMLANRNSSFFSMAKDAGLV